MLVLAVSLFRADGRTATGGAIAVLALLLSLAVGCGSSSGEAGADAGRTPGDPDASVDEPSDAAAAQCGDGVRSGQEACDDGNGDDGDGCSSACALETDYACPTAGDECVLIALCGNGIIEGSETCDDRDRDSGDGCSATCAREPGWNCPLAGTACVAAACGDGVVAGLEACDDGDTDDGDGCDSSCRLEEGYYCPAANADCELTVCGDGVVQGLEECDDQNLAVGDGCTPFCKREPRCANGDCEAVCGDGVRWMPEECDDSNTLAGDGCSPTCTVEPGFECVEMRLPDPPQVSIPMTVRDFVAGCNTEGNTDRRLREGEPGATAPFGHPDFECYNKGLQRGLVRTTLDADGKPERIQGGVEPSAASLAQWYRSDDRYNRTSAQRLTLQSTGNGAYQLDDTTFFVMDGMGFVTEDCGGVACEQTHVADNNFHFTTEVRYWFEYNGTEILAFSGDDDVWVYINGRLAVDLGGVHGRENGSVNLGNAQVAADLGLTAGKIYEAVVFQAERHTSRSQYRLTLTNFNRAPSVCSDTCGDGVVSSREVCDSGANNGMGDGSPYGGCAMDCTLEPFCGDGMVDDGYEVCDDGLNLGGDASSCAPGCQMMGSFCGDGVVQPSNDEQCDDGNMTSGDGCSAACKLEVSLRSSPS